MTGHAQRVATIGAGIGGLTAAAALSRCLAGLDRDGVAAALKRYERTRLERTATIQRTSAQNTWLRGNINADLVYGYDARTTPRDKERLQWTSIFSS